MKWTESQKKDAKILYDSLPAPALVYGLGISTSLSGLDFNQDFTRQDASFTYPDLVQELEGALATQYLNKILLPETKLLAMNAAHWSKGMLVHAAAGQKVFVPVGVDVKSASIDRFLVVAEKGSDVTILESSGGNGLRNSVVEVAALEDSKVRFISFQHLDGFALSFRKAVAGKNARVEWIDCAFGSGLTKTETTTDLNEERASTYNVTVFFGLGKQRLDQCVTANHIAPRTESIIISKGAVAGSSSSIFSGLIKIGADAKGSAGHQKSHTLILDDSAKADAIPKLQIDNNDVTVSHAAAVGQIDDEVLFYLMSRGLSKEDAVKTVVKGFFDPVTALIPDEKAQETLSKTVERRLDAVS